MKTICALAGVVIKELYRRKDFYVLFVLTALITIAAGSAGFFKDIKVAGYLKELCLLLIWISSVVIAVMTTARQIPAEIESRTIFPLLAKPVTRAQVVIGKFLGCWLACAIALLLFYVFFVVVVGLREHHWPLVSYLKAFGLHWAMLGVVTALVLLGSLVFAAPSSNGTICLVVIAGILFIGQHLHKIALRLSEPVQTILSAIYFLIPHLEWYDVRVKLVNNHPLPGFGICFLAFLYAAVYAAMLLLLAWFAFRRKSLHK